jgi:hypothetical protein
VSLPDHLEESRLPEWLVRTVEPARPNDHPFDATGSMRVVHDPLALQFAQSVVQIRPWRVVLDHELRRRHVQPRRRIRADEHEPSNLGGDGTVEQVSRGFHVDRVEVLDPFRVDDACTMEDRVDVVEEPFRQPSIAQIRADHFDLAGRRE